MKECCQCRDGENHGVETDGEIHIIRDPEGGQIRCRGYICDDHLLMFNDDGYFVDGV